MHSTLSNYSASLLWISRLQINHLVPVLPTSFVCGLFSYSTLPSTTPDVKWLDADRRISTWWLQMPWRLIGARSSATIMLKWRRHVSKVACYQLVTLHVYHVTAIKHTLVERGREVANPSISLLTTGSHPHSNNALWHRQLYFTKDTFIMCPSIIA